MPKIDKVKKASEYRPINVLSIFEKVLELVVKEQFEMYLVIELLQNISRDLENIICSKQRFKLSSTKLKAKEKW